MRDRIIDKDRLDILLPKSKNRKGGNQMALDFIVMFKYEYPEMVLQ